MEIGNYQNLSYSSFKNNQKKKEDRFNVPVLAGTVAGTAIPLAVIKAVQNKGLHWNIFNIKYGLPQILIISAGSIMGGLAGGIFSDKTNNSKPKIKEAIFQFLNISVPTCFVAGFNELADKIPQKGLRLTSKVASFIGGVLLGMQAGAFVSNKINTNLIDKNSCDRKIKAKDYLVHVDDFAGAAVVMGIPALQKLHLDKILPAFYVKCGYDTGTEK